MIADQLRIEMRLRDAQYYSLVQLEDVLRRETIIFKKDYTDNELANLYRHIFRSEGIFDYNFPSFCFALATGVGKTRLLGACIYILHKNNGWRNFFVVAPNRTIYEKFIREFNEKSDKYIFAGITDLPGFRVFTGEDCSRIRTKQSTLKMKEFNIYIFNIDKFKSKEKALQIKNIDEYIGESFYEHLSKLSDLVIIMDESHKYKTPIAMNAINGLRSVLGLECTATPFKRLNENEKTGKFNNILYEYPLGEALAVEPPILKRPQLLWRKDFDYDSLPKKELHDVLISDGLDNHERIKVMLESYFNNEGVETHKRFKPLVLVVCENISHAINIEKYLKDEYADGKYKDKIIRIHSTPKDNKDLPKDQKYDEDTEIEKLLELENADNIYEIVINVSKLGLGWDVKNIYTIIPLRAFDSQVFVEQTIGRGLRLPFKEKGGDGDLKTLRIAYHSNFGKIIQKADAWLKNIEVIEPPKRQIEPYLLRVTNDDKVISIPLVESKIEHDFSLTYFNPEVPANLGDIEITLQIKDLATGEEKEIGKIEEKLKQSAKEYILTKLIELPHLSVNQLDILDRIVTKYLKKLSKDSEQINLEDRLRIIKHIDDQIKTRSGGKTSITYKPIGIKTIYTDYETHFDAGFTSEHFEHWDDNETKRGLVTGYKKSIYSENVFDTKGERIVAKILEKDTKIVKWLRPYKKENFSIIYQYGGDRHDYIPDFIAESNKELYIIECKSKVEVEKINITVTEAAKTEVRKKAEAAAEWIEEVNNVSNKKWEYLLIPHDRIKTSVNTFNKLRNQRVKLI